MSAGGALLLHVMLVVPLALGMAGKSRTTTPDIAEGILGGRTDVTSVLIMVAVSSGLSSEDTPDFLAPRSVMPDLAASINALVPTPDLGDAQAFEEERQDAQAADSQRNALLTGQYLGQVMARIERAWARPRTPIDADRFSCRVKIEQDRLGRVSAVELMRCNGTAAWQRSLVSAIELASPLSAPSNTSLPAGTLVLDFSSFAYDGDHSNEDLFEPAARQVAHSVADSSYVPSGAAVPASTGGGDIELKIVGKQITWAVRPPADLQEKQVSQAH